MNKVTLITYILAFTGFGIHAQLSDVYVARNFGGTIDYYIVIFKNGCYFMDLSQQLSNDLIFSIDTSHGNYTLKNDEIILTDVNHGFEMKLLLLPNKTIKVKKGFAFMRDRYFGTYGYDNEKDCWTRGISPSQQKEERAKYNREHETVFPLRTGFYYCTIIDNNGYLLNIQEDNGYTLSYLDILLSEWIWKREKNELSLYDVHLEHSFYLLIGENCLISKYLPGEYLGDTLFYRQNR
jgi:hypothetical protein